ncbi:MAG: family 20 glycosylhydrolase [Prevotella sp.]|nr:family 20 glycosylhydrolase [Prevotella sp.]
MNTRKIVISALVILGLASSAICQAKVEHILPKPKQVVNNQGNLLVISNGVRFTTEQSDRIVSAFENFLNVEVAENSSATPVSIETGKAVSGSYNYALAGYPNEAYQLTVSQSEIAIKAVTETGVLRAVQTLAQMAEGYDGEGVSLECCTITDWPAFKLRGYMHDIGRSYITFEELKKQIKLFARFKINTFHMHLTENQGWRFEVKQYPQLTAASSMTRFAGKYYTQAQCRELEDLAYEYGITIIPEIDMPGHSGAFERAMGHSMQTDQGVAELKNILTEVANTFTRAPYIHIGGDEVTITYPNFLQILGDHVKSLGKKVVCWNKLVSGAPSTSYCDMTQMWATRGSAVDGVPNIDCRYNYINHFDLFADVVGIYKSNIYYAQRGNANVAGTISAVWNDRYVPSEINIMRENNVYASVLASAERAWMGGGKQYIEVGGTTLPGSGDEYDEFADWERRFLFHKDHSLKNEKIPYVRQTNVHWKITDAFPNGGNSAATFPPETLGPQSAYTYQGQNYATGSATGAGIYLRHVWGTTIPGYYANPQLNTTAYAWTYVYSPVEQQAGALIEFQNYSRSERDGLPANGSWDKKGSRIWFNDTELKGPTWQNAGVSIDNETPMRNENAVSRTPVRITLKQGWNKVFMKLPYVNASGIRLNKWMFVFVITDTEGKNALEGLTYSPQKLLDENASTLADRIDEISAQMGQKIGTQPGFYDESLATTLKSLIEELEATLSESLPAQQRNEQLNRLNAAFNEFQTACQKQGPILPTPSTDTEEHWYSFCSSLRDNLYTHSNGAGAGLTGGADSNSDQMLWKFVKRADGTFDIINRADGSYISPTASYDTQIKTSASRPAKGWTLKAANTPGMLIITCGTVELNQTPSGHANRPIFNWSEGNTGNDTADLGCQFAIREVFPPSEDDVVVRIASTDNTNSPANYGDWDSSPWTHGWTSNENNTKAGVRLTSETAQFNQSANIYSRYVFALKPSAAGATDEITITAPEDYVILAYSMQTRLYTANEPYELRNEQQAISPVTTEWRKFGAANLHDESTSFTISASGGTNNQYLCITNFTVTLQPKTATGINGLENGTETDRPTPIYDLSGRKVATQNGIGSLKKGIYIANGQKIVIQH